jgi:hypothetical protein
MELLMRAAQPGQGSHGGGGTDGPLRRGGQHQLGLALEEVGAHVVYGVFGYKTHAKMLMVVRREEATKAARAAAPALRASGHRQLPPAHRQAVHRLRPAHLQRELCADVNEVFKQLTGLGKAGKLNHLLAGRSPCTPMLAAIRAEAETPAPASACASSPR